MSDEGDRLNPLSDNFDPLFTLYSESEVELPFPDAPVLDTVTRFERAEEGVEIKQPEPKPRKARPQLPKREEEAPSTSGAVEWKPDGKKNVLNFMLTVEGPLAKLRDCMERRVRIKVVTRGAVGVRGELTAYLAAFDKMWNLALESVTEVWTRKKKKKTPCLSSTCGEPSWRVNPPKVEVTPIDRKTERCQRHVPKMLMRGEHVVTIQILE